MTLHRRLLVVVLAVPVLIGLGWSSAAHAAAPGLQVNPLQYEDTLTAGRIKNGYVDVANPGDAPLTLISEVKGFRQAGTNGDLEFFADTDLATAITVDLTQFTLGPREAVRVVFSVNPDKLPAGSIYAVIFFRTIPPDQSSQSSYIAESTNVGTLLALTNGSGSAHHGQVTSLRLPFWQLGSGLRGNLTYHNPDPAKGGFGYRPQLTTSVVPWGQATRLATGLVLPDSTRQFALNRPGSFLGLLPVTVTDLDTHHSTTRWVFALTGWWTWGWLVLVGALAVLVFLVRLFRRRSRRRPKSGRRKPVSATQPPARRSRLLAPLRWLRQHWPFWRRRPLARRPLDGLSRRPTPIPAPAPTPTAPAAPEPNPEAVPAPEPPSSEPTAKPALESAQPTSPTPADVDSET